MDGSKGAASCAILPPAALTAIKICRDKAEAMGPGPPAMPDGPPADRYSRHTRPARSEDGAARQAYVPSQSPDPRPADLPPYGIDNRVRQRLLPVVPTRLRIKITAKRQATFPAAALKALRVKPGDYLELIQDKDDWRLAPAGVDFNKLGTLRHKIAPKHPSFNLAQWREIPKDHARLRD